MPLSYDYGDMPERIRWSHISLGCCVMQLKGAIMADVRKLKPWRVHKFPWGTAVKHVNGRWEKVYLHPDGQEINVSGLNVSLDDRGIKFK